jgi:putative hemolysin
MSVFEHEFLQGSPKKLNCLLADTPALIQEAQALRYRVFAEEMGAHLKSSPLGLDQDEIDDHCHHLIVYDNVKGRIAGYTRVLTQEQARHLGRFYSQSEFNLDAVLKLPGRFLEVGRTCVDPAYRGGAVLTTLWTSLVDYALVHGYDYLMGCASITPGPGGFAVDAVFRSIDAKNKAGAELQVTPLLPVPLHKRCRRDESGIPPLLKAYLRFGALVCGEPYWDADFNCMDLFIILPLTGIEARYSKHYLKSGRREDAQNAIGL